MTLPLLLAQAAISEATPLTMGLAIVLSGGLLAGSLAYSRLLHRTETAEKALIATQAQRDADALRISKLELKEVRTDERLDQLFDMMTRIETKLDRYFEHHDTRPKRAGGST